MISLIHYGAIATVSAYHLRKHPEIKLRAKVIGSGFFIIFIIMIADWVWSFSQHLKWRTYVPPTGETAWLDFQPTPFGTNPFHDWQRWIFYISGFLIAVDFLKDVFVKNHIMSLNKRVITTFLMYSLFWILLTMLAPNPLYVDVGLWKLWPKLAQETGYFIHVETYILADVISRFILLINFAWSWFHNDP